MRPFLLIGVLVGGIFLSVKLTAWVNYFTYGQNCRRLEKGKRDCGE